MIPQEGGFIQLEGAAIIRGSKNIELAQKFLDFMLEDEFQKELPLNQWMFPVTAVPLPKVFDYAVLPQTIVSIDNSELLNKKDQWIAQWEKIMY
jgi:thiamine transport system substrate-binding protein